MWRDRKQPNTLEIPQGTTVPIRKLVSASFTKQDELPVGTYIDTVYVDIITGDKETVSRVHGHSCPLVSKAPLPSSPGRCAPWN